MLSRYGVTSRPLSPNTPDREGLIVDMRNSCHHLYARFATELEARATAARLCFEVEMERLRGPSENQDE